MYRTLHLILYNKKTLFWYRSLIFLRSSQKPFVGRIMERACRIYLVMSRYEVLRCCVLAQADSAHIIKSYLVDWRIEWLKRKLRNIIFPKTDNIPKSDFTEKYCFWYGFKLSLYRFPCKRKKDSLLIVSVSDFLVNEIKIEL